MPSPITSKHEMYRRLNAGLLGHTVKAFETLDEVEKGLTRGGLWAIRSKVQNRATVYNLTPVQITERVRGMPPGSWNVTAMLQDEHRICYAHLIDAVGGWHLHYSEDPKPCKLMESVDGCKQAMRFGLSARTYLKTIMDDIAWDTLLRLVDDYPDHVIEFSVMSSSRYAHGSTNTIFWEVRCTTGEYERDTWR